MMEIKGKVFGIDQNLMLKISCENGRTSLVEILDSIDIPIGDTIIGSLMNYGDDVSLYSTSNQQHFSALIQNLDIPKPN